MSRRLSARYAAQAQHDASLAEYYANRAEEHADMAEYYGQVDWSDHASKKLNAKARESAIAARYHDADYNGHLFTQRHIPRSNTHNNDPHAFERLWHKREDALRTHKVGKWKDELRKRKEHIRKMEKALEECKHKAPAKQPKCEKSASAKLEKAKAEYKSRYENIDNKVKKWASKRKAELAQMQQP